MAYSSGHCCGFEGRVVDRGDLNLKFRSRAGGRFQGSIEEARANPINLSDPKIGPAEASRSG